MTRDEVWVRFVERGIDWAGRVMSAAIAAEQNVTGGTDAIVREADTFLKAYDERFPAQKQDGADAASVILKKIRDGVAFDFKHSSSGRVLDRDLGCACLAEHVGAITQSEFEQCRDFADENGDKVIDPWWTKRA